MRAETGTATNDTQSVTANQVSIFSLPNVAVAGGWVAATSSNFTAQSIGSAADGLMAMNFSIIAGAIPDKMFDNIVIHADLVPNTLPSSSSSSAAASLSTSASFSTLSFSESSSVSPSSAQLPVGQLYGSETPVVSSFLYGDGFANPDLTPGTSCTPFTFIVNAGITRYNADFSDTDGSSYEGEQFCFLQSFVGTVSGHCINIAYSAVSTSLTGLQTGSRYLLTFAYANRNPASHNAGSPSEVSGLVLNVTLGQQPIFTVTLNADQRTFIAAEGSFTYAHSAVLTFNSSQLTDSGDQSMLLDAILVTAVADSSSSSSSSLVSRSSSSSLPGSLLSSSLSVVSAIPSWLGNDTLYEGEALTAGQYLSSVSGYYTMILTAGGDLVLQRSVGGAHIWQSYSSTPAAPYLVLQGDCNLVLYSLPLGGPARWSTGTAGHGSSCLLILQDDRNLVSTQAQPRLSLGTPCGAAPLLSLQARPRAQRLPARRRRRQALDPLGRALTVVCCVVFLHLNNPILTVFIAS